MLNFCESANTWEILIDVKDTSKVKIRGSNSLFTDWTDPFSHAWSVVVFDGILLCRKLIHVPILDQVTGIHSVILIAPCYPRPNLLSRYLRNSSTSHQSLTCQYCSVYQVAPADIYGQITLKLADFLEKMMYWQGPHKRDKNEYPQFLFQ